MKENDRRKVDKELSAKTKSSRGGRRSRPLTSFDVQRAILGTKPSEGH